jgi:hypothetical protein
METDVVPTALEVGIPQYLDALLQKVMGEPFSILDRNFLGLCLIIGITLVTYIIKSRTSPPPP